MDVTQVCHHVIRRFSPTNLKAKRFGPAYIQDPPEASFQNEFYKHASTLAKGRFIAFPEFRIDSGRIDFYLPEKQWGIEIIRNGNEVAEHCGRFSTHGKYTMAWLPFQDYIILDFRTKSVHRPHLSRQQAP